MKCSVGSCEKTAKARGLCDKHWQKWKRWGNPEQRDMRGRGGKTHLGRKRSEAFKRKCKAGIVRRQLEGKPFGHPRKHPILTRQCLYAGCGKGFIFIPNTTDGKGMFCSIACHLAFQRKRRGKLPDDLSILKRMYVDERMSTTAIAKFFDTDHRTVARGLDRIGVARRGSGPVSPIICVRPNCNEPAYKLRHHTNGCTYGTLCFKHWWLRRREYSERARQRNKRSLVSGAIKKAS